MKENRDLMRDFDLSYEAQFKDTDNTAHEIALTRFLFQFPKHQQQWNNSRYCVESLAIDSLVGIFR